ncbi:1834_t:CDS:2, partial [Acaulospora colombiana]
VLAPSDLDWVSLVAIRVHYRNLSYVSLLLMDQIVFSHSMEHLQFWLECARSYLQGIRCRYSTSTTAARHMWPNSLVGPGGTVHILREVLLWVLKRSGAVRSLAGGDGVGDDNDVLDLEKIATKNRKDANNKAENQVYMTPQRFEFVSILPEQEWEQWIAHVRVALMRCSLSGGMGIVTESARYVRDPENYLMLVSTRLIHRRLLATLEKALSGAESSTANLHSRPLMATGLEVALPSTHGWPQPTRSPPFLNSQVKESARPEDPLTITDDTTAWEIYNHRAAEVDRDLLKDWNDNLNTLLIFTLGLLQEDSAETTRDILLVITRQLANNSIPAFEPAPFTAEAWAIRVNGFFFASIMCSLVVALFAVLALQWIAGYDAGLTTPSPSKRAAQRQLRYMGMESISAVVMAGAAIGAAVYLFTTAISTVWIEAPFRTQTSKTLAIVSREILVWLRMVLVRFPLRVYKEKLLATEWAESKYQIGVAWRQIREATAWPPKTFAKCEEQRADSIRTLHVDSLMWLANSIDILPSSRNSILILLQEFMELPPHILLKREWFIDAPWENIFTMLCKPYFGRNSLEDFTAEDLENLAFLCRALGMIFTNIKNEAFEQLYIILERTKDDSLGASVCLAHHNYDYAQEFPGPCLEDGFICACRAIREISPDYFHYFLLYIRDHQEHPVFKLDISYTAVEALASAYSLTSEAIRNPSSATLIHPKSVDTIFDVLSHSMRETIDQERTPVNRYVSAMEDGIYDKREIYRAMFRSL